MRKSFALLLLLIPSLAFAQPKKEADEPKLKMGDKAPAIKVTKWLQGEAVAGFEKDKVYVIEFWATWCGPCIGAMPHLSELQEEYKSKGLVVIGLTSEGRDNGAEKVAKFVEKNGKKFNYRFAFCEDKETDKAYMEAAKQDGIPCSFVIGKDGNIAYIGHPMNLDDVLPKVIAGTWKGKEDLDAIAKIDEDHQKIMLLSEKEPEKALTALAEFEKNNPGRAKHDSVIVPKMLMMLKLKKYDDAKTQAEAIIAVSDAKKKPTPAVYVGLILVDTKYNPDKKLLDIALKAADTSLKYNLDDVGMLIALMDVYIAADKKDKAKELGAKAVAGVESAEEKKEVQEFIDKKLK